MTSVRYYDFTMEKKEKSALERAQHYGIDTTLTSYNLSLTPEKRLIQHQNALDLLNQLIRAKRSFAREKDIATAKELEAILEQTFKRT